MYMNTITANVTSSSQLYPAKIYTIILAHIIGTIYHQCALIVIMHIAHSAELS